MPLRTELISEVVRDLLGPRFGVNETLDESPLVEYITGVLQPADLTGRLRDLDTEAQTPEEDSRIGEEDLDSDIEFVTPTFSPALDPKSRPSVFGLSFEVAGTLPPKLSLCVTWARYHEINQNGKRVWKRQPRVWTADSIEVSDGLTLWLNESGHASHSKEPTSELSLHFRLIREGESSRILLQLVNRIPPTDTKKLSAGECIYQPSVRILLGEGLRLIPMRSQAEGEEGRLEFLYRNRPAYARGHLCSATWREIDPERPLESSGRKTSLTWLDSELLDEENRDRFLAPDVRSEFIPMYALQAPSWEWMEKYGQAPVLDAAELSRSCEVQHLIPKLEPLVNGYEQWVRELSTKVASFNERDARAAEELLDEAKQVLDRMRRGLEVLKSDQDARLAFCFANRAMDLQASWKQPGGTGTLRWRPFQLGFILSILESLVNPASPDRTACDLLWVPTGGGKTEAYLAIAAFVMAYRRRRALRRNAGDCSGAGTAVISRYTLRLLTLQQFRRALAMVTACEFLRVQGLDKGQAGWRPEGCTDTSNFIWGTARFSIGLWVGGGLTPNRLNDSHNQPGAISILGGKRGQGEPAQVLTCPACDAPLALPKQGLPPGKHRIHLVLAQSKAEVDQYLPHIHMQEASNLTCFSTALPSNHTVLTLDFTLTQHLFQENFDKWWKNGPGRSLTLCSLSATRPGYFARKRRNTKQGGRDIPIDFEIWCPNPECPLGSTSWCESVPADDSLFHESTGSARTGLNGGYIHTNIGTVKVELPHARAGRLRRVIPPWQAQGTTLAASRVPIPAQTVDDQLYAHPPSLLIATVDKFARLAFEPRAARLFGNVNYYHPWDGYTSDSNECSAVHDLGTACQPLDPPELILQDEVHLLEGPLGSMVGLYEIAIDTLTRNEGYPAKYISSSATVREAGSQIRSIFDRKLAVFPPRGLEVDDRFFLRTTEPHPLDESRPGQLFVGLAAPGTGPLKPIYRLWSVLLQAVYVRSKDPDFDYFKTLVGYFNAVRELAGARALTRQDIRLHLQTLARRWGDDIRPRPFDEDGILELSSRADSTDLPAILERLSRSGRDAPDALLATSMFGTGVDVSRLSLMVVHGQPKTTSSYIQAAGRVGRARAGLVFTFLRASRPRDLSHYEFFCGYHRQIYRHVEPVTVMPFSPGALDLVTGPVMVALLITGRSTSSRWKNNPRYIALEPTASRDIESLLEAIEARGQAQPELRKPESGAVRLLAQSELDRWKLIAHSQPALKYWEYSPNRQPTYPVVLGDAAHQGAGLPVVYENAPQSLREVEETISIDT